MTLSSIFRSLVAFSALSLAAVVVAAPSAKPDIVFIIADDLGWADVAFHGGNAPTPHLDRLRREGVELTQHYVAPVCSPTRTGLMTGRVWSRFGVTTPTNERALPWDTVTLPRVLKSAGYDTCLTGKWHLGSKPEEGPNHFGFDHSYGSLAGGVSPWNHRYKQGPFSITWHRNEKLLEEEGQVTDLIAAEATKWIASRGEEPFFLYVPFTAVHLPVKEPAEWVARVPTGITGDVARHYAASVMHLDDAVGRIITALEKKGRRENTLLVFTSDNGGSTSENNDLKYPDDNCPNGKLPGNNLPLRGQKGSVYEGGTRVPTLLSWPAKLKPGTFAGVAQITDWMPTFCALAEAKPAKDLKWDGIDLWPQLSGAEAVKSRAIYTAGPSFRARAVRDGDWKLIVSRKEAARKGEAALGESTELYDLASDPNETTDLAAKMPDKVTALRAKLNALSKADRDALPKDAAAKPNVLFLISDDLTATALSCYGNTISKTPNIDRLAAQGTRFTRAFCNATYCGPSRASFMSGYYPHATGVLGYTSPRLAIGDRATWAQHFKNAGYYTARVSKIYHMGVPGGIEEGGDGRDHNGGDGADDPASWTEKFNSPGPEWKAPGIGETLEGNPDGTRPVVGGNTFVVVEAEGDDLAHSDGRTAAKAVELIEKHASKSFFLAVGFVRPHVPFVAPQSYFKRLKPYDKLPLPPKIAGDWDDTPKAGINYKTSVNMKMDERRQRKAVGGYYASVAYMDAQVGKVLAALEKSGQAGNTIVIFTSDHGYHLGEHDFWAKVSLRDESAMVPLIIKAPGKKPSVCDSLTELIDLYPTVASLCGLEVPARLQGKSIARMLDDPAHRVRESAFCVAPSSKGFLLREDQWAFIQYAEDASKGVELFDAKKDPQQFTNLAEKPEFASVVEGFKAKLTARLQAIRTNDLPKN